VAGTRQRLMDGAMETIRKHGIAGASARVIAGTAGVNQALIFYHFTSVDDLIAEACRVRAASRVEHYRERFASVSSVAELLTLGRDIHARERELGNVTVLTQVLSGAHANPKLAAATRAALDLWTVEVDQVLSRLLADSPLAGFVDPAGLASAVSAGFVGLELLAAADPDSAEAGLGALEQLGHVAETLEDLGPVARRAVRSALRPKRRA
jgi:AcrR family transcriptional regulator